MTDQSQKRDAGKPRPDLIPWNEFEPAAIDYGVESVAESLRQWWSARPVTLTTLSIPTRQLPGIARVLAFGAAKYAPRGWESGIQYSRLFAAAQRHSTCVVAGDLVDAESGLAHESHFWCNVLFLVVFSARGRVDLDDRPPAVPTVIARFDALRQQLASMMAGGDMTSPPTPTSKDN